MSDEAKQGTTPPAPEKGAPEKTAEEIKGEEKAPEGDLDAKTLLAQKEHFRSKFEKTEAEKSELADKLAAIEKEKEEAAVKAAEENNEFKTLYETEKAKNSESEQKYQGALMNAALAAKLAAEGCVDAEAATMLVDKSTIAIDDKGTVTGVDEAIATLKESKQYLFSEAKKSVNDGSITPTAGGDSGAASDTKTWKKSEIAAMSTADYVKNKESINKARKEGRFLQDQ